MIIGLLMGHHPHKTAYEIPKGWPTPTYDFKNNPPDEKKIRLGEALFYDPILSADNSVSCENCHSPYVAFTHIDHPLSHGIKDSIGKRNAPALMNLAWHKDFMWDGAINHLDLLPLAPISHPAEMGSNIQDVIHRLGQSAYYRRLFQEAWHLSYITSEQVMKSLSQYMLSLVSADSKYDRVQRHQDSFTTQEQKGYAIFKQHCASCHTEPLFTNGQFENNGLPLHPDLNDKGRMVVSLRADDSLKFKVPTLRNIEYTFPYMHDGRFSTLSEVIKHYNEGIQHHPTLSRHLNKPMALSSNEKVELMAFLLTLSDPTFIRTHQAPKKTSK